MTEFLTVVAAMGWHIAAVVLLMAGAAYYSGIQSVALDGSVRPGPVAQAYCNTCGWAGDVTDYRAACHDLAEHRRTHEAGSR